MVKQVYIFLIVVTVLLLPKTSIGQRVENENEKLLTAGFQFRPVFSNDFAGSFLGAGEEAATDRIFTTSLKPALGFTFGMVIRRGITKKISIETGINYIKRSYTMTCVDDSLKKTDVSDFGIVSYEIPVQGLIYVRLGKRFYMNNSLGLSFNWYASDVANLGQDNKISQRSYMHRVFLKPAMLANIGFEYRTEKAGIFYTGFSWHKPFTYIATSVSRYDLGAKKYANYIQLSGTFLTVDLKYFFHSKPIKPKAQGNKKKKTDPKKKPTNKTK